ncbi:MAG: cytochrome c, partial [Nitrospirota bacterium]
MTKRQVGILIGVMMCVPILSGGMAFPGLLDLFSSDGESPPPLPAVPADYAGKHIPDGWWTDPKVLAEGEKVYTGQAHPEVHCSNCHGKGGQPKKKGARDLRNPNLVNRFSDSFWFWRVREGVPKTKMPAWKEFLKDEQIWAVMA